MKLLRPILMATVLAVAAPGLTPAGALAAEVPTVVASIKPVHSLVAGVMGSAGEPHLLVRGGGSPHNATLRPSDARALASAKLVFLVDQAFERFLERPLKALAAGARVVQLSATEGLRLLPLRAGGPWQEHGREQSEAPAHEAPQAGHDGHEAGEIDLHLWLDPANAVALVEPIAEALRTADPERAALYEANASALKQRLRALDRELGTQLTLVAGKPYIVFHDAYHYLEARYGLTPVGSLAVSPDRAPGAARLSAVRAKIRQSGALCAFVEPQFEPRLVRTVVAGTGAQTGVLDPLGAEIPDGPELYFELMRANAAALRACLLSQG